MTSREFLGDEFYRWAMTDYRNLRQVLNKGVPDPLERALYKSWDRFYRAILRDG